MSEGTKSAYAQAKEALARTQKKIEGLKERGETLMGEATRTLVGSATAFTAGFADQRFGEADADTGIRVHKVNGAPTALLAGLSTVAAAGLGAFGKAELGGFAAGQGAINSSSSSWGRMFGERLRVKAEKADNAEKKAEAKKTNGKADEKAVAKAA